ncbi:hypothetical protein ABEO79_00065 [Micromonospora provocatoris]
MTCLPKEKRADYVRLFIVHFCIGFVVPSSTATSTSLDNFISLLTSVVAASESKGGETGCC